MKQQQAGKIHRWIISHVCERCTRPISRSSIRHHCSICEVNVCFECAIVDTRFAKCYNDRQFEVASLRNSAKNDVGESLIGEEPEDTHSANGWQHIADTFALSSARHLAALSFDDKAPLKSLEASPVSTATSTPRDDLAFVYKSSSGLSSRLSFSSEAEWIFFEDDFQKAATHLHVPLRPDVQLGKKDPDQVCATWCPLGPSCAAHGGAIWYGEEDQCRLCNYNLEDYRRQFQMETCSEALPQQPAQPPGFFSHDFFS